MKLQLSASPLSFIAPLLLVSLLGYVFAAHDAPAPSSNPFVDGNPGGGGPQVNEVTINRLQPVEVCPLYSFSLSLRSISD